MWQKRGGSLSPVCEARYGGSKEFAVESRAKEEKKVDRMIDYRGSGTSGCSLPSDSFLL